MSRPKSATVTDIDIDIADILGQKYLFRIDIGNGNIDPPLNRILEEDSQAAKVHSQKLLKK